MVWTCTENGRKQNFQKSFKYEFVKTRLKGTPRNRQQDEVTKDGRLVGGTGWKEGVHNREWKQLLRMVRNHHILYMPRNECLNEWQTLPVLVV